MSVVRLDGWALRVPSEVATLACEFATAYRERQGRNGFVPESVEPYGVDHAEGDFPVPVVKVSGAQRVVREVYGGAPESLGGLFEDVVRPESMRVESTSDWLLVWGTDLGPIMDGCLVGRTA